MNFTTISEKIRNSTSLDFGSIFSRSIELFKHVWLQGFITVLLTLVTIIPFYVLLYIPLIANGINNPEMMKSKELPPEVLILMLIMMPIIILGVMSIGLALNAAFLRICRLKDSNETGSDHYFFYFKKQYLGKLMKLSLMMLGLGILGMLACGVGIIYLVVPFSLFPAFLAFDKKLSATEIVKSSFALGNKNWLVIFGLILIMGILAELGILLCIIGILFTAMLAKVPVYYMYKDGVGFPLED